MASLEGWSSTIELHLRTDYLPIIIYFSPFVKWENANYLLFFGQTEAETGETGVAAVSAFCRLIYTSARIRRRAAQFSGLPATTEEGEVMETGAPETSVISPPASVTSSPAAA